MCRMNLTGRLVGAPSHADSMESASCKTSARRQCWHAAHASIVSSMSFSRKTSVEKTVSPDRHAIARDTQRTEETCTWIETTEWYREQLYKS
eukprot:6455145-Amphidinium_carterae.2